ncbi:fumarylacetoacetate hydrolase family protein [Aliifodinibius sp. S!AR15-10]|uniref:fumarylacetoacetate hydrolase family protein n=1 Tax=Aliifodinibius sp. S!AR15-10 TaxID=2950437 RepID=UPI0028587488|nr:fumarylacetoacetate hydrolase family protein [Aliifodinibius sp. S!AR15-10]MDR8392147.1 fumarylacetoacetate hydrolase family protein [Aliifodinibius sp. S!AR15-10]
MNRPKIPGLAPALEINSIFCIGRNYVDHIKELNNEQPDEPIVFFKPITSILFNGGTVRLPRQSTDVHHEVELVIAIGKKGRDIPKERALEYVAGYGVGIDITARDLQTKAKNARHPWSVAKGFDTFAPVSSFVDVHAVKDPQDLDLKLEVNNSVRQHDNTNLMIFPVTDLISYLSGVFTLHPGDLIFTGTPAGVSPLKKGDQIKATLGDELCTLSLNVDNQ